MEQTGIELENETLKVELYDARTRAETAAKFLDVLAIVFEDIYVSKAKAAECRAQSEELRRG